MEGIKTRGICYVETREGRGMRLRQIDDGSIHYEVIGDEGWKEEDKDDNVDKIEGNGWEDDIREEWKGEEREGRIMDVRIREDINDGQIKKRLDELREMDEEGDEERNDDVDILVDEWKEEINEKWMIGKGLKVVYEYHMEEKKKGKEGEEEEDEYEEWSIPANERLEEELERVKRRKEELLKKREEEKIRKQLEREQREFEEMERETTGIVPPIIAEDALPILNETVMNLSIEQKEERQKPVQDEISKGIDWLNF